MIELIIGILLGFFIVLLAMKTGFDKDSSFYPVLLIVIAFYYVLFAFQANDISEIIFETSIALIFSIIAILGHHRNLKIVGIISVQAILCTKPYYTLTMIAHMLLSRRLGSFF